VLIDQAREIRSIDTLRGIEGDGARRYYAVFDHLIRGRKPAFSFTKRSRRPPLDRVNALLSFLYSMLAHDCTSALETVGLDSQVGFLHRLRPGRASLALDIMEELRPYLVDRMAISLINNNQVDVKDFVEKETGAVLLKDDSRKKVLDAWQSRKQQTVQHTYLQEKIEVGLIPYAQALLMARHIRGDLDGYPPYLIR
jgi:CRISPR-associated protein Cas1